MEKREAKHTIILKDISTWEFNTLIAFCQYVESHSHKYHAKVNEPTAKRMRLKLIEFWNKHLNNCSDHKARHVCFNCAIHLKFPNLEPCIENRKESIIFFQEKCNSYFPINKIGD